MKQFTLLAILIFGCFAGTVAQTNFGFLLGGQIVSHSDATELYQKSKNLGANGSVYIQQYLFEKYLTVELDFSYSFYKNEINSKEKYTISYLNQKEGHDLHSNLAVSSFIFPILLKLNYNRLHPFIGAQYQFIKSSREDWDHGGGLGGLNPDGTFSWTYQDKIYIKPGSSDYGWLVGIDVDITSRLGLRFSYYKGSKNIISYEITRGILNNEGGDYSEEGTRNEIMSLGLTYTPNWQLINQNRKSKNREKFSFKEWIKELY